MAETLPATLNLLGSLSFFTFLLSLKYSAKLLLGGKQAVMRTHFQTGLVSSCWETLWAQAGLGWQLTGRGSGG